ncbi:hypothetical protein RYH73_25235 [Olivibacter sp. CPCC 100613]|uniref:FKBP-type peptidyl-prolyl cis-trans isomerase n=1 Tax=Olivibacter sp. CPCC 100613 TaxID=3079931 RepID=UPI002FF56C30
MDELKIEKNRVVSLRYRMVNSRGEVIEDLMNGPAISYRYGDGKIIPQLENELVGLKQGDQKKIKLQKDVVEGLDDNFELEIVIDAVRSASEEEIATGLNQTVAALCDEYCSCYR